MEFKTVNDSSSVSTLKLYYKLKSGLIINVHTLNCYISQTEFAKLLVYVSAQLFLLRIHNSKYLGI